MKQIHNFGVRCVFALGLATTALGTSASAAEAAKCLFVSSYHQGYAWSDGVERGLRSVLTGKCEIRQFDMDTKRRKSEEDKQGQALAAKAIIESWRPDIVIAADDNAAKYLIQQYYRDHDLPFVFNGVNWSVDKYGFPYSNVTGMVEVAPIDSMLERARDVSPTFNRAFYLGANTLTEKKNLERFQDAAARHGLELDFALAGTMEEWIEAYGRSQDSDLVIMGSNAGINDWDRDAASAAVKRLSRRLSVTNHGWMMPYTMVGVTKVPEEQGEWAGKTALRILDGMSPTEIPIVANNRRDIWINTDVLDSAAIDLPKPLLRKAKRVTGLDSNS